MKQKTDEFSDLNDQSYVLNWITNKFNLKINSIVFVSLILFASCSQNSEKDDSRTKTLPYYNEANFTPLWLEPGTDKVANLHNIPNFSFTNQDGVTVTENTFNDKIYVTNFFFTTCPGICPKMTSNMKVLQDHFIEDKEVLLLSHSVTPEKDSIPVLKRYADQNGTISTKWHLVTGDRDEIYNLGRTSYFVEEDLGLEKSKDEFLHTENFILVDKNKHIRGIYNGLNKTSIQQLITDIETLKKEE